MRPADLAATVRLADEVFPDYREDRAVFAEKLWLYPEGCFVLPLDTENVGGYVFSHPWITGRVPALNQKLGALPPQCDCLYLHDLTLAPARRGQGLAGAMVRRLETHARQAAFERLALTSLAGSTAFWRAAGFRHGTLLSDEAPLTAYGPGAQYMVRDLR
ncbi:hypothetical protein B5C34_12400 [Pacificimonas flava]|uniref:N-acetyltransferase domain-containing protein n=2 Tax=Pacificimonas TaxID=1960290 RepID=A0A219B912_9SPHN|nr:hypothetical protein B5C34_12400 [Pacificimonas flava]